MANNIFFSKISALALVCLLIIGVCILVITCGKHSEICTYFNAKVYNVIILNKAIADGDVEYLKQIIKYNNGIVNQFDMHGHTPLYRAIVLKKYNCIKILLNNGANPNVFDYESGYFPLHIVAANDDVILYYLLANKGANLNVSTKFIPHDTPLHIAIQSDSSMVISCLLKSGADINTQNAYGMTPLHYAAMNNSVYATKQLLLYNANKYIKDIDGRIPIDYTTNYSVRVLLTQVRK